MNSPISRVILSVLGGYALILLFLTARDWYREEVPRPPAQPVHVERIQHPLDHGRALDALESFGRLPPIERTAIRKNLESLLIPLEQWLCRLERSDVQVLCLGELHEETTRTFLANWIFTRVRVDVLLLEVTPKDLRGLMRRAESGRRYFPLLGADIMEVLRTVKAVNPKIRICGIEETPDQEKRDHRASGSRDQHIAHNFWEHFRPGLRHVVLFGAFHCAKEPNWLYGNLWESADPALRAKMLNVRVAEEHENGPVEAFLFFLDEIGLEKERFVISENGLLHPWIFDSFPMLSRQILEKYKVIIIFRQRTA